jgi:hypothetical protein
VQCSNKILPTTQNLRRHDIACVPAVWANV